MESYSVLMSVYEKERPEFLRQSIDSMLCQTVPTDDFVLVCDGPLPEPLERTVEEYEKKCCGVMHVVRLSENQGLGAALNAGLSACRNELVARMDSDDISVPRRCALQLAEYERRPELSVLSGTVLEFENHTENVISEKKLPLTNEEIIHYAGLRNPFNHPAVMYRKSAVIQTGGYRQAPLHEDYDLWTRMLMKGYPCGNLPDPLVYMRVDEGFYQRRGGLQYCKTMMGFHRELFVKGFSTHGQYLLSTAMYLGSGLMSMPMRRLAYRRMLRKKMRT